MKKLALLFVAILTAGVSSCSKDDDAASAELTGKWEYSKEGSIANGQEVLTDYEHEANCAKDYVQINATQFVIHNFDGTACIESTSSNSYTRSGNTIITTIDGMSFTGQIAQLNNSTLKITTDIPGIEGQSVKLVTIFIRR